MLRYVFIRVALCLTFFTMVFSVFATHSWGKDIQYICLGPSGNNMQYKVIVHFYRSCWDNSFQGPATIAPTSLSLQVSATGCSGLTTQYNLPLDINAIPANGTEIVDICTQQQMINACVWSITGSNPPYPGVQIYTYSNTILVPQACGTITLGVNDCCRNSGINNISNPGAEENAISCIIQNGIDPLTGAPYSNNSAQFTNVPLPLFWVGSNCTYNAAAYDPDGDSLVYELIHPQNGFNLPYQNINFTAGYTVNCPVRTAPPNSFYFNTTNGQFEFVPAYQENDVVAFRISEYRNGVLVGTSMRDCQFTILQGADSKPVIGDFVNVSGGYLKDSATVQACPGTLLNFDVPVTQTGSLALSLNTNAALIFPGIQFTQINSGSSVNAHFQWQPQIADTGCYNFTVTAKNNDCPVNGMSFKPYTICVGQGVSIKTSSPVYCGQAVLLQGLGGSNPVWEPSTGNNAVTSANTSETWVSPLTTQAYTYQSDCGTDSVTIGVAQTIAHGIVAPDTVCSYQNVFMQLQLDSAYGPYTFQWQPASSLFDSLGFTGADTMQNPVAKPINSTTYTVEINAANGCRLRDSIEIIVTGTGHGLNLTADPLHACKNQTVHLNLYEENPSCSVSAVPDSGTLTNLQVGYGLLLSPSGSPTQYPTVFGHFFYSSRHQFLYHHDEIGARGQVQSISFYLAQINTQNDSLNNFEIKIGCTTDTGLTKWTDNLITVYNPKTVYIHNTGWQNFTFDYPYNWDGTTNLVVEVCSNTPVQDLNGKMQVSATPFHATYYSKGNYPQCGFTNTPLSTYTRPNTRFSICRKNLTAQFVSWDPDSGVNALSVTGPGAASVQPQTSQTFQATVVNTNGCSNTAVSAFSLDTTIAFTVNPTDTDFCKPTAVNLTATVSGTAPGGLTYNWQNLTDHLPLGTGSSVMVTPNDTTVYLFQLFSNACDGSDTVIINVSTYPVSYSSTDISCNGSPTGSISLLPAGGQPPYSFSWVPSVSSGNSAANLSANTYNITVTDSAGCTGYASVLVSQPPPLYCLLLATPAHEPVNDGTAYVYDLGGGVAPYTVQWSNGAVADSLYDLAAGVYTATVTDVNGCQIISSVTVGLIAGMIEMEDYSFLVLPNPADNKISVLTNLQREAELTLSDILGRTLASYTSPPKENAWQIEVSSLPEGLYYISLKTTEKTTTKPLVIKR